ncbi:MAG TPA: helix-hairpin-helix domain-containing protein [Tepidisphaeraceae bacterium]|jgi:hypothetical protein
MRRQVVALEEVPNIGPAMGRDLRRIGVRRPAELVGKDPYALYERLCRVTGKRHDPCVIDAFISAVRFMEGAPARPWWAYTKQRKAELAKRRSSPTRRGNRARSATGAG